ncbi:hypothetical protein Q9L58_004931 [Maublancomyces gigas]|uniref:Uncharacterized protein n=1 Tax=Discina gigas TaxID=1032678 RepID=A0ABR3GJM7_9PEZI
MTDSTPAPAYGDPPLPPYTSDLPAAAAAAAPPAQKLWFQSTDTTGLYRRRLILPCHDTLTDPYSSSSSSTPPPGYADSLSTPLYTVRNHSQHSSASPRGSLSAKALRQPDLTVYAGEGDNGPVIATAMFHNKKLQRGIGEFRLFPRCSSGVGAAESSVSAALAEPQSIVIKECGDKKHGLEINGVHFEWAETGPGEQRDEALFPPPPPPPAMVSPPSPGLFGKFKKLVSSPPRTPPTSLPPKKTVTLQLSRSGVVVATYIELQPLAGAEYMYRAVAPGYRDGHCGSLEVEEGERDVAVVSLVFLLEYERREMMKDRNRGWGSVVGVGGGLGGGGF